LPDCDLLLVGKGPLQADLERLTMEAGLTSRVHFAGWQSDVPAILAASQLLVLPSQWEGMPNVVLQAMASRLPVVATDVEGVCELLGPQTDLQTIPYGDSRGLVQRIVQLLSDPRQSAQLGEQNRLRVEQHFALQRMVTAYQDLWQSLIPAGKKGGAHFA
jgi:glycosyltransferase involved in cell wall biosynthesis